MKEIFGRFIEVNLADSSSKEVTLPDDYYRDFIGGASLAARLFCDYADASNDPLSADNPLFIMNGPLTGTNFPGSSRFVLCAKSPLTSIWGESASGGSFGSDLKKAGWITWSPSRDWSFPCTIREDSTAWDWPI